MTKRLEDEEDEAAAFARAMAAEDVVPIGRDGAERAEARSPVTLPPIHRSPAARDQQAGSDVDADFAAPGVDRRELRKLKRGEYPVSARCDLHGLTADAARDVVKQFIATSRHKHRRCICIVHGRGLRSPGGVAVLKGRIREFLRSHPAVLAYADAPRSDGGGGAVYVLLRRS
ncbi:MAG: Smr domain protein [Acidobacteria bacterium]|nr:Smr domain protein [Acidobacteriota bacterium]